MADNDVIAAEQRDDVGKGASRAMRRAGRLPAVVYGGSGDSRSISIVPHDFAVELAKPGFFARLYDLEIDGTAERVLPRELQVHPVTDVPMHVDFLRVTPATRLNVDVPVDFANEEESPGLKEGGVLNIVRHTIEVTCRADSIPAAIIVDLTGRVIGDSMHISEVDLPEGVVPTITDRDFTIATVAAPSVLPVEEEEEGLEGEDGEILEGEEGEEGEAGEEGEGAEEE